MDKKRKIIFLTVGTRGDLYPFLGLAVELQARGHPVMLMGSEDFRRPTEDASIEFESILTQEEHDAVMNHPQFWKSYVGLKLCLTKIAVPTFKRSYQAIERQLTRQGCVLVCNNIVLGGLVAAEKFNLPVASVYLHPYSHFSLIDPPMDTPALNLLYDVVGPRIGGFLLRRVQRGLDRLLAPINELRHDVGLASVNDAFSAWRDSIPIIIDLWPDWFCSPKADWPAQAARTGFINYDGPVPAGQPWINKLGLADFLERKPLVFSMGSGMIQNYKTCVQLFSDTCEELNREGLLVSPAVHGCTKVSERFRVIEPVPFAELFSSASHILTHGGIGTVARALEAGKPMLVAPLAFDQFDNGHFVQKLGVGLCLPPFRRLTAGRLAAAFEKLDAGEFASRCLEVKATMLRENGLGVTVAQLEKAFSLDARPLVQTNNDVAPAP